MRTVNKEGSFDLVARRVCRGCNEGWMEAVESDMATLMTSAIRYERPVTLNRGAQAKVAHVVHEDRPDAGVRAGFRRSPARVHPIGQLPVAVREQAPAAQHQGVDRGVRCQGHSVDPQGGTAPLPRQWRAPRGRVFLLPHDRRAIGPRSGRRHDRCRTPQIWCDTSNRSSRLRRLTTYSSPFGRDGRRS